MIAQLITKWRQTKAEPWQFWLPDFGPVGGIMCGAVALAVAIVLAEWLT